MTLLSTDYIHDRIAAIDRAEAAHAITPREAKERQALREVLELRGTIAALRAEFGDRAGMGESLTSEEASAISAIMRAWASRRSAKFAPIASALRKLMQRAGMDTP